MKRNYSKLLGLFILAGLLVPSTALGKGATAPQAKKKVRPLDDAMKPKVPPGPARKMKILLFASLTTRAILKLQFQDRKGNATTAPDGGTISFTTNVTKPRRGKKPMTQAVHKPKKGYYVFTNLPPRRKHICPPRWYWIRVFFKAGRKRFRAYFRKKFNCI